jgi:membrane protease YdiL (CAAX protease family)
MAVGSKSFPEDGTGSVVIEAQPAVNVFPNATRFALWAELLTVFGLLEAVLWTPRSFGHGVLVAAVLISVLWFSFRRNSSRELGLTWPEGSAGWWILAVGLLAAVAIPTAAIVAGYPVPANPDWPKFQNVWPYVIWAVCQQFLLLSFFYLRLERLVGSSWAVAVSSFVFTIAHLPNMALTAMTVVGALFFTEVFRRYRSIVPLGIAHAMLGIAIAYSFPNSVMHHMRVGLSFWQLR